MHAHRSDPGRSHEDEGQRVLVLRHQTHPQRGTRTARNGDQAQEDRTYAQHATHPRQRLAAQRLVRSPSARRLDRDRVVAQGAGLEVAAEVVQRDTRLLERCGGFAGVAVHQGQQEVDRVDAVVAKHLRLTVRIHKQLAQRQLGG